MVLGSQVDPLGSHSGGLGGIWSYVQIIALREKGGIFLVL